MKYKTVIETFDNSDIVLYNIDPININNNKYYFYETIAILFYDNNPKCIKIHINKIKMKNISK